MKAHLLFAIGLLALARPTFSQSTPPSLGPVLTLSDGQCAEVIPADTLRRIGRHAYSTVTGKAYRFSFNGQEKDDEVFGATGTSYSNAFRSNAPRVARFLSLDPLASDFAWNSPYCYAEGSPIAFVDLEGLERFYAGDGSLLHQIGDDPTIRIVPSREVWNNIWSNAGPTRGGQLSALMAAYDQSVLFHQAAYGDQTRVASRIYAEVNGGMPGELNMTVNLASDGHYASTSGENDFIVYPNAISSLGNTTEFSMDNYNNQSFVWKHEKKHSDRARNLGASGMRWAEHFDAVHSVYMKAEGLTPIFDAAMIGRMGEDLATGYTNLMLTESTKGVESKEYIQLRGKVDSRQKAYEGAVEQHFNRKKDGK